MYGLNNDFKVDLSPQCGGWEKWELIKKEQVTTTIEVPAIKAIGVETGTYVLENT